MPGNPIGFSDLFNFEDDNEITKAIKLVRELRKAYSEFQEGVVGQAMQHMSDQQRTLADTMKELVKTTKQLSITNKQHQETLLKSGQEIEGLKRKYEQYNETKRKIKDTESAVADSVDGLTKKVRDQTAEYRKLSFATDQLKMKALSADIRNTQREIAALTGALKVNTSTFAHAKGSYNALDLETKKLIKDFKELPNAMDKTNVAARKLESQIKANTQRLKEMDAGMGQSFRNVGNYKSAFDGVGGSISRLALGYLSLNALTSGFNTLIDTAQKFESLDTAILAVTGSIEDFNIAQTYLNYIADKYGQNIGVLAGAFKGLSAATRGTRLEGDATRKIFESVIQASTVLKLTNEQTEGSLLAIQQMMSKGKVSAEELRGQLGERLPGAFRLFAEALGVNEAKLGDMLQKSEVLAQDALPKFAKRLNEVYGKDAVENANALVNETNRLSNAFDRFLVHFADKTGIKNWWKDMKAGLAGFLDGLTYVTTHPSWKNFKDLVFGGAAGAANLATNVGIEQARKNILAEFQAADETERQQKIVAQQKRVRSAQDRIDRAVTAHDQTLAIKRLRTEADILKDMVKLQGDLRNQRLRAASAPESKPVVDEEKAAKKAEQDAERARKKFEEIIEANTKLRLAQAALEYEKGNQSLADTIAFENTKLKILKEGYDQRAALYSRDSSDYKQLQAAKLDAEKDNLKAIAKAKEDDKKEQERKAEEAARKAKAINKAKTKTNESYSQLVDSQDENALRSGARTQFEKDEAEDAIARLRTTRLKAAIAAKQEEVDSFKEKDEDYYAALSELYGLQEKLDDNLSERRIKNAEKVADRRLELEEKVEEFIVDTANSLLDLGGEVMENRIEQLENQRARDLEGAGQNAAARAKIEEEYQKKVVALKRRQALFDRTQALFNIGVDLRRTIMKNNAEMGTIAATPFNIIAAGQAAVAAAMVLAQPLPKYKKGRRGGPGEWAVVNDPDTELIKENGRLRIAGRGKETVTYLQPGATVFTAKETKEIITEKQDQDWLDGILAGTGITRRHESAKDAKALGGGGFLDQLAIIRGFKDAVQDIPVETTVFNERGFSRFWSRRNSRIEDMNARNKIGGNG